MFLFQPGCCCCVVAEDDFNRANSMTLGDDWGASSWTIIDNKAEQTNDNVAAIHTAEGASSNGVITVLFTGEDYSDQVKLIISYEDSDNYLFALFELAASAGGCGTIKLYQRVAGVETQLGITRNIDDFEPDEEYILGLCRNGDVLTAYRGVDATRVYLASVSSDAAPAGITGVKAGFASGTITTAIQIDDYRHEYYRDNCQECNPISPCTQYEDLFTRSSSTTIGCGWVERAGDWEIVDNANLQISTTNAFIELEQSHPKGEHLYTFSTTVIVTANASKVRIIFNYEDSSNFWFAEVEWGNDPISQFIGRIGKRVATIETVLVESPQVVISGAGWDGWDAQNPSAVGEEFTLFLAVTPTLVRFCRGGATDISIDQESLVPSGAEGETIAYPYTPVSTRLGLGTGDTLGAAVKFKQATFGQNQVLNGTAYSCSTCLPWVGCCANERPPASVSVTFATGDATDGTYVVDYRGTIHGTSATVTPYAAGDPYESQEPGLLSHFDRINACDPGVIQVQVELFIQHLKPHADMFADEEWRTIIIAFVSRRPIAFGCLYQGIANDPTLTQVYIGELFGPGEFPGDCLNFDVDLDWFGFGAQEAWAPDTINVQT